MSEHTEDLRLAEAGALDVTLYSRPGCHLCEAAKAAIHPLLEEFGATLHEINIDGRIDAKKWGIERFRMTPAVGDSPPFIAALQDVVLEALGITREQEQLRAAG